MHQESWLVELIGSERDLIDFTRWFPDEPAKVQKDGESFFLSGDLFRGLKEHADVRSAAENEIKLMSAAVKLNCGGLTLRPELGAIYRIDSVGARHAYAHGCNLVVKTGIEIRVFDDPNQRPTAMQKCVQASRRNKSLNMAMILWADNNRTWPRLYRILEEVEHAFNGQKLHKIGLLSKTEYDRFKHSANCHEIAGVDSRHGPNGHQPPKHPMTIYEAESFISNLLGHALSRDEDA